MQNYQDMGDNYEPSADELIDVLKNLENLAAVNPALYRAIVDQIKGWTCVSYFTYSLFLRQSNMESNLEIFIRLPLTVYLLNIINLLMYLNNFTNFLNKFSCTTSGHDCLNNEELLQHFDLFHYFFVKNCIG